MDEKIMGVYANLRALKKDAGMDRLYIRKSDIVAMPSLKRRRCFAIHATEGAHFHTKSISKHHQLRHSFPLGDDVTAPSYVTVFCQMYYCGMCSRWGPSIH